MSAFKSHQMLNSSRIRLRHSRLRRSCLKSQVAKSGRTELLLVDPAVKINGAFYRDPCFVARDLSWRVPYLRQNSTHGARDNQPSGTADSRVCFIRTSSSPQITAVSCHPFKSNRFI